MTHKMWTEQSQLTSASGSSGHTASSGAGPSSQAGSSSGAGSSASASLSHAHDQTPFIEFLALTIAKERMQTQLLNTIGALVCGDVDVTKFIEAYKILSSCAGTDVAAEDDVTTVLYYCSGMILETKTMMNWYLTKHKVQWREEPKNALGHPDGRVYMYMRSYFQQLCRDQLECGNVGLQVFILSYDNISCIGIATGALAEYSQVKMLLKALPWDLRAKAEIKLELDPQHPSTFKYYTLRNHVLYKCATANPLALLDLEGARTVPGVSPYSMPAGVPLPQMPVVVNLPAIPNEETPAPVQATEDILSAKAENMIDTKMDNMMKVFEGWTCQLRKANEARYGCYHPARVYAIRADHPPTHTHMDFPPPNAHTGAAYYQPGANYQQYPQQESGPCINSDELGHICIFCLDVRTD